MAARLRRSCATNCLWRAAKCQSGCDNLSDRTAPMPTKSADDLFGGKELRDFARGSIGCVGAMHGIFADRFGMHFANSACRSLRGVRCAHDFAIFGDGVL